MKTKQTITKTLWNSLLIIFLATLLAGQAHGQIYVANPNDGTVGKYHLDGTPVNASFISGLASPFGLALSGSNLYVATQGNGTIGVYDATSGAAINANFIRVQNAPPPNITAIALSGNNLYVVESCGIPCDAGNGSIGVYNATTGAAINPSLVTGLFYPQGIAISGNNLYVPSQENLAFGYINEYDATTGAPVDVPLISGLLHTPENLVVSGNVLYEANADGGGTGGGIGTYNATTGAVINASFITGVGFSGLALLGNHLYLAGTPTIGSPSTIGVYDATTGATINASLISGLTNPVALVVVPEPGLPQSISDLISIINSQSTLNGGQQKSFVAKLQAAQSSIASNKSNAACGQLGAFVKQLNAFQRTGGLDQTTANTLISFVTTLEQSLGCPP